MKKYNIILKFYFNIKFKTIKWISGWSLLNCDQLTLKLNKHNSLNGGFKSANIRNTNDNKIFKSVNVKNNKHIKVSNRQTYGEN